MSILLKVRRLLKRNVILATLFDKVKRFYYIYLVSDEQLIKRKFKKRLGRDVELRNPIKFNDKLQWLKLNWYDPIASRCADKYEVREIVSRVIGPEYLNRIYAVYESVDEIDISILPDRFAFKATHGSGFNIVCADKSGMNWDKEFQIMRRWLRNNYYISNREWIYKGIKPRIICERYLEQIDGDELRDYRFFCFNGDPKFISVDFSITDKKRTRRNLYDIEWNLLDAEISYPKELSIKVDRPGKLKELIELSKKLSAPFPHARVDFYYIADVIIFGEITFFHQSGMGKINPEEFEIKMGNWLILPDYGEGGNRG